MENDSRCFPLQVYDKMTWFGALAHCKTLNGTLHAGNFSSDAFHDSPWGNKTHFWTGNLYEAKIDVRAHWRWLDGSVFEEWDKCKIVIADVGCDGCGFWRNRTIYLTSNCKQNLSYLCDSDPVGKF